MLVQKLRVHDLQSETGYVDGVTVYAQNKVRGGECNPGYGRRVEQRKRDIIVIKYSEVGMMCCFFSEAAGGADTTVGQG